MTPGADAERPASPSSGSDAILSTFKRAVHQGAEPWGRLHDAGGPAVAVAAAVAAAATSRIEELLARIAPGPAHQPVDGGAPPPPTTATTSPPSPPHCLSPEAAATLEPPNLSLFAFRPPAMDLSTAYRYNQNMMEYYTCECSVK